MYKYYKGPKNSVKGNIYSRKSYKNSEERRIIISPPPNSQESLLKGQHRAAPGPV